MSKTMLKSDAAMILLAEKDAHERTKLHCQELRAMLAEAADSLHLASLNHPKVYGPTLAKARAILSAIPQ